jgi:hypothetical protein
MLHSTTSYLVEFEAQVIVIGRERADGVGRIIRSRG